MAETNELTAKAEPSPTLRGLADVGLFLLRLHAGVSIASAGFDKFPTAVWFDGQVAELGFPSPSVFAFLACFSEFAGGLLLVLGLWARPAALCCAATMGVAAFVFHADQVTSLRSIHVAHLYFWVFLALTFIGPGRLSLDAWLPRSRNLMLGAGVTVALALVAFTRPMPPEQPDAADAEITSVQVAGSFNDWDLTATPAERDDQGVWRATVDLEAGAIEFKFAANESWDLSGGETDQDPNGFPVSGSVETGDAAGNIRAYIPGAGRYEFAFDPEAQTYELRAAAP